MSAERTATIATHIHTHTHIHEGSAWKVFNLNCDSKENVYPGHGQKSNWQLLSALELHTTSASSSLSHSPSLRNIVYLFAFCQSLRLHLFFPFPSYFYTLFFFFLQCFKYCCHCCPSNILVKSIYSYALSVYEYFCAFARLQYFLLTLQFISIHLHSYVH